MAATPLGATQSGLGEELVAPRMSGRERPMVQNLHGVYGVEMSIPKEIHMAKDAHNKAAEHHENAAKAHRMAAEHHGKGDHASGKKYSTTALEQSGKAHDASKAAHEKSGQQK
jgi:hypothetical protein